MAKKQRINDDFLTKRGQGIFTKSVNWRNDRISDRWKKSNNLYDGVFESTQKDKSDVLVGQGRLFIPKTYSHVQRILVDMLDAFFFDPEEIVSIGNWKSIPTDTKDCVKTLLNYRLGGNPINFFAEAYEVCLDALKNKVGILKVWPELEMDGDTIKTFDPQMACIPYEDVFFDIRATWKDYWKFPIVHRMLKSVDELKRKKYKNVDKVQNVIMADLNDEIKQQRWLDQGQNIDFGEYTSGVADWAVCYEIWDFLDVNNDGLLEACSYFMAGDAGGPQVMLRSAEENFLPYRHRGDMYNRPPFVVGHGFPEPHKMYGKDLPEIVEGLQRETNAQRNQRREAVALALRKPILASRSAGIDLMTLVNRKIGSVVMGDDVGPNSVRELNISDPTASSIQEQAKTDQDFYETTSQTPNQLGMPTNADETATAVTSNAQNANKKVSQIIRNVGQTAFVPAFQMLLRLEQYYENDEFIKMVTGRVLGWEWAADSAPALDVIQGDFELHAQTGLNKQLQLNKLMLMTDRGNQYNATLMGMVQAGVVSPQDVEFFNGNTALKRMFALLGEKAFEEFVVKAQQPPPQMQEGGAPGVASQTGMLGMADTTVSGMNPEGVMALGA